MQDSAIYQQVYDLRTRGHGLREAARTVASAQEPALNADSVRKRAMRYAHKHELPIRPVPEIGEMPPVPPLAKPYPKRFSDADKWTEVTAGLQALGRPFTVLTFPDFHFPDHNPKAIQMTLKIAGMVQPDVAAVTGDMFDFAAASSFLPDPFEIQPDDIIEQVKPHYAWVIGELKTVCPDLDVAVFEGNHGQRPRRSEAYKFLMMTIEAALVALIRQDGRALWIGPKQETQLDTLFIQHGKRVGENAAKNSLKDIGYGVSQVQAHNHTPGWSIIRQRMRGWGTTNYRLVTTASTGCLCNIPPHYQTDTDTSRWINGVALIHVYPDADVTNIQQIPFHPYGDGFMAFVGDEVLTT